MAGGRPLSRTTLPKAVRANTEADVQQRRNHEFPGLWVYVGDPLGIGLTTIPDWQNNFFYVGTNYVGFRHGLDGQLDMVGMYDLTLGAVSGDVAFTLPVQYVIEAPPVAHFPIELAPGVWSMAVQTVDSTPGPTYGDVQIFWPIVADPVP